MTWWYVSARANYTTHSLPLALNHYPSPAVSFPMVGSKVAKAVLVGMIVTCSSCMGSGDNTALEKDFAPASPANALMDVPDQSDRTFIPGRRFGMITPGMPPATIENLYGSVELVSTNTPGEEGQTQTGYLLFPGTRDEVTILLAYNKQPGKVVISQSRSRWRSAGPEALAMGMNLPELTEANGGPFVFSGFGWDYGGTVTDWCGGRLSGTLVRLSYAAERLGPEGLSERLIGDVAVDSRDSLVQAMDLHVREIVVDITARPATLK